MGLVYTSGVKIHSTLGCNVTPILLLNHSQNARPVISSNHSHCEHRSQHLSSKPWMAWWLFLIWTLPYDCEFAALDVRLVVFFFNNSWALRTTSGFISTLHLTMRVAFCFGSRIKVRSWLLLMETSPWPRFKPRFSELHSTTELSLYSTCKWAAISSGIPPLSLSL